MISYPITKEKNIYLLNLSVMIATIFCCNAKRGRFQTDLYPTDKVLSYFPKRTYGCVTPPGTVYSNCHSSNVIYPIQCLKC